MTLNPAFVALALLASLGLPSPARAQAGEPPPSELDALQLADQTPETEAPPPSPWRAFVEGALAGERAAGMTDRWGRVSLDWRWEDTLAPGWRARISDRLDITRDRAGSGWSDLNTVREAALAWSATEHTSIEVGRINLRQGLAYGFNPTDWFKHGAVRSPTSIDPEDLRENRQGSLMLRTQHLWSGGSFSAAWSPGLGSRVDREGWGLNEGATNAQDRWLLAGSLPAVAGVSPQWSLHGGAGMPTKAGLNLSALISEATVAHAEWAGAREVSMLAQAGAPGQRRSTQRAALGLTHTTPFKLSLTLEAHVNTAAPSRSDWDAIADPAVLGRFLDQAWRAQDLIDRRAWFVHLRWQDAAGLAGSQLSAFWSRGSDSGWTTTWLEWRKAVGSVDVALQWSSTGGASFGALGAPPRTQGWQILLRHYWP